MLIETIWLITELSMLVAGVIGCYLYQNLPLRYRLITLYILLAISTDLLTIYFRTYWGYNLFLLPIYSFIELVIFSKLYVSSFIKKEIPILRRLIFFAQALTVLDLMFICNLFHIQTFHAYSKVITDIIVITYCLMYYFKILTGELSFSKELFLLNSSFVYYFSINVLIFLSVNFLINESLYLVTPFWMINALSALFLYNFLTYMIWQHGKSQKILRSGYQ